MRCLRITTSWDDGHPSDQRLADLLVKYGIGGTFYVPCSNSERRPVLEDSDLRHISKAFEIGGHTLNHRELTSLRSEPALRQVADGKECLEDVLGGPVYGFCYPRGGYNNEIREIVRASGFQYSRTIKNLFFRPLADRFEVPTTVQFFPHGRTTYFKNYVRHKSFLSRTGPFYKLMKSTSLVESVLTLVDISWRKNGCFHLWGHSWELDEFDLWDQLEEVLKTIISSFDEVISGSNREIYSDYYPEIAKCV
jgi:Polysaccharide deacetylase